MDFFAHQDAAQRKTWLLVAYFVLAVALMSAAVYFLVLVAFGLTSKQTSPLPLLHPPLALGVLVAVPGLIGIASLMKTIELGAGGEKVATLLGGTRINANSLELAERRLQNVVEEMALAAGLPVPPIFVLPDEAGINAFAAGHAPQDAVIAVSRGALEHLTRDELQGVVAHEFSHILRGDMRLNVRLMGWLYGIQMLSICGYYLLRGVAGGQRYSRRRSRDNDGKGAGAIILVAAGVWLIGSIGLFFGRLIKAAISRQREFLADASAVEFTRNPDGISGALKKIGAVAGGSAIRSPEAENAGHMFFASGVSSWLMRAFDTHPPLAERIRRIDPAFAGELPKIAGRAQPQAGTTVPPGVMQAGLSALAQGTEPKRQYRVRPEEVVAAVGSVSPGHLAQAHELLKVLPGELLAALEEPFSVRAAVACLLLASEESARQSQLLEIRQQLGQAVVDEVLKLAPLVNQRGEAGRLPIIELAQPALKSLSASQYAAFRETIQALIRADRRLSLFEFVLQRTLLVHLDRHFRAAPPPSVRYASWNGVSAEAGCVLAALCYVGHSSEEAAQVAFAAAMREAAAGTSPPEIAPCTACTLSAIGASLDKLAAASPAIKKRLIAAAAVAVSQDGQVTIKEAELLRAVADSLDCPLPPWHDQRR